MTYFERIEAIENALCEFQTDLALRFILQYHGYQLFDEGFYQYLVDEGILPDDDDDDDDDDEDEDEDEGEENDL